MPNKSDNTTTPLKIYQGEDLNVSFNAKLCSHGGACIKNLPSVFNLKASPWINLEDCDTSQVITVVNQCPSGALSYQEATDKHVSATLIPNGPINFRGEISVKRNFQDKGSSAQRISLCRCGLSKNKPFCDASHRMKFKDAGQLDHRPASKTKQEAAENISITCVEDGPLMCQGNLQLIASDGEALTVIDPALCRCGASKRKPFCDGSHNKISFKTEY